MAISLLRKKMTSEINQRSISVIMNKEQQTLHNYNAGMTTKRFVLKTELAKTKSCLYVWENAEWNDKLQRIKFATSSFEICQSPPSVLLAAQYSDNPDLYDYLCEHGVLS